jgi:DNA-binding winged helix-turn-helix (wHTH) protein
MASREVFHFDEFTLAVQERRLLRSAEAVRLSPKAYDVLVALVHRRGRLVTKDELLKRLWPESFVEEGGLSVHASALRKALGEDARRPAYIETVARSGYRFIAAVTCDPAHEKPLTPSAITRPVELYELVGRGRSHLLSGSYFEMPAAVDAFRSAIEIDPSYAAAHAGLARARCVQAAFRVVPHQEAFTEAKASALRTLAMDSTSADAQVASARSFFLASGTGRRRNAACAVRSRSIRITPRRSCSMGRSRKRERSMSTPSMCWRANSLTTSIGRSGTSIDSRPGPSARP